MARAVRILDVKRIKLVYGIKGCIQYDTYKAHTVRNADACNVYKECKRYEV